MSAITPFDSTNFLDGDEYPSIIMDYFVTKHKYLEAYEELKFSFNVLKAIYSDPYQKGVRPNRLRAITLRLVTAKMDNLIAQARMNSGITKCFILGILHKLKLDSCSNPQAIIVCPTTEMAEELNATLANIGRFDEEYK
ncbi:DEAD-box ATP-dependent RNA helicase 38 [Tanacetum coccineum]